eukprot:m.236037 g.236037  ORF g.236037 m.236037 type:complete len:96 (+) comp19347_c0_seq17:3611-3898(+)
MQRKDLRQLLQLQTNAELLHDVVYHRECLSLPQNKLRYCAGLWYGHAVLHVHTILEPPVPQHCILHLTMGYEVENASLTILLAEIALQCRLAVQL